MRTQDYIAFAIVGFCLMVILAVVVTLAVRFVLDVIDLLGDRKPSNGSSLSRVQPMSSDWQWPSHLDTRDAA